MFKIRDRVVCIDNSYLYDINLLQLNNIYIIEDIFSYDAANNYIGMILEKYNFEFNSNRFISLKEYRKQKLLKLCSNQEISY